MNREAEITQQNDFHRRESLDNANLLSLFAWDEPTFLKNMEGSAIRRIGHYQWLRNIAIAMGNAPHSEMIISALHERLGLNDNLDIHLLWAIEQQQSQQVNTNRKEQRLIRIIEKGLPRDA